MTSLAMASDLWFEWIKHLSINVGLVLGMAFLFVELIPKNQPIVRSWVWRVAFLKVLFLMAFPWEGSLNLTAGSALLQVNIEEQVARGQGQGSQAKPVFAPSLEVILFLAWSVGAGLLLGQGFRRRRPSLTPVESGHKRLRLFHRLNSGARLLVSDQVHSPFVSMGWESKVVFPRALFEGLSEKEFLAVLRHELTHLRRWDPLWNLVTFLVRTVFFFHPVVLFAVARAHLEDECAADQGVAQGQDLMDAMLSVERFLGRSAGGAPVAANLFFGKMSTLKGRISRMGFYTLGGFYRSKVLSGLLVAGFLVSVVPFRVCATGSKNPVVLVVEKSSNKAYLYNSLKGVGREKPLDSFAVSFGKGRGDKLREGDLKTPEGVYLSKHVYADGVELNYPNSKDHLEGKTGSGILLKGNLSDRRAGTSGCIAMESGKMRKVAQAMKKRNGVIVVVSSLKKLNPLEELGALEAAASGGQGFRAALVHPKYGVSLRKVDGRRMKLTYWKRDSAGWEEI